MKLKKYKAMLIDFTLCTPKNKWNLTNWNSQNSDDFKNVRFATQKHDIASKRKAQKYDPKTWLISNFR